MPSLSERTNTALVTAVKATSQSTIFDIPMPHVREDQRHRRRFTRKGRPAIPVMVIIRLNFVRCIEIVKWKVVFRATSHLSVRLTAMRVAVNEVSSHLRKTLDTNYSQNISADRRETLPHRSTPSCKGLLTYASSVSGHWQYPILFILKILCIIIFT